jgi:pentatricopeptide repeat protein
MSIMFKWLLHLVSSDSPPNVVKNLLRDMACVGLRPDPDILQSLVLAYWEKGSKEHALELALDNIVDDEHCVLALMRKMIHGEARTHAIDLVFRLRTGCDSSTRISFGVYNLALLAVLFEQKQLTESLQGLRAYRKKGILGELKESDENAIGEYEKKLHRQAEQIASWALEEHPQVLDSAIYRKLLAMYCISGRGLEATQMLWSLKMAQKLYSKQKPIHAKLFNTVLGICAYGNHMHAARAVLNMMKDDGLVPDTKSYEAMFGGFANGGHAKEAIHSFIEMLDLGLLPDRHLTLSAMKQINKVNDIQLVYKFGKSVVEAQLVDPFVVYINVDKMNLSIIVML